MANRTDLFISVHQSLCSLGGCRYSRVERYNYRVPNLRERTITVLVRQRALNPLRSRGEIILPKVYATEQKGDPGAASILALERRHPCKEGT